MEVHVAKFTVSTKADKNAAAVNTALEVIDEGCSREVLVALATQTVVIRWQNMVRKNDIPPTASIRLADFAPGVRHAASAVPISEQVKTLSSEERGKLLELLKGMQQ